MKNIDNEKLQEIIEIAVEKVISENSVRFINDFTEEVQGKKYGEALGICVGKLYKESYRAVGDVLHEILELLN